MPSVVGGGSPLGPVETPESHPRAKGFRDGVAAAVALLAIGLAAGVLTLAPSRSTASSATPSTSAPTSASLPVVTTPGTSQTSPVTPAASLPPVAALTIVWIPGTGIARGAPMQPGCTFSFDFGLVPPEPIWETCPAEGPIEPVSVLYADPGATVSIENSTFTPSTSASMPAAACGTLSASRAFVTDPHCHLSYAPGQQGEFTFGLPEAPGRWVVAVRGCLRFEAAACGSWYAVVNTVDPVPAG